MTVRSKIGKRALLTAVAAALFISAIFSSCKSQDKDMPAEKEQKEIVLPVIMYHSILKDEESWNDYVLSPDALRGDIEYLKKHGYQFVLTADVIEYVKNGRPLPQKPVILTFDDGCYNFLTYVEPILRESGAKAVLSVVGSYAEKENGEPQSSSYSYLNYSQIEQLSKCGYVEIASHSYDMHELGMRRGALMKEGETYEEYRSAFVSDLLLSIDGLENNCGITPQVYTYPYGLVCEESLELVKACRFSASYGVEEKPNYITRSEECLYCMNRYNRPSGISTEEFMSKALSR